MACGLRRSNRTKFSPTTNSGPGYPRTIVRVQLTRHLFQFFPSLEDEQIEVEGGTVAEVLEALEARAPGIAFYVCDERGRLRQHVNVFVGDARVKDRTTLTDTVPENGAIHIIQALSGG